MHFKTKKFSATYQLRFRLPDNMQPTGERNADGDMDYTKFLDQAKNAGVRTFVSPGTIIAFLHLNPLTSI